MAARSIASLTTPSALGAALRRPPGGARMSDDDVRGPRRAGPRAARPRWPRCSPPSRRLLGTREPATVDAARGDLLVALAGPLDGAALAGEVEQLYRYGDADEKRAVLLALHRLPLPGRTRRAAAARRAAHQRRPPRRRRGRPGRARALDDDAWRHAVLKCLFTGVPLAAVAGLDDRADAETRPDGRGASRRARRGRARRARRRVARAAPLPRGRRRSAGLEQEPRSQHPDRRDAALRALAARDAWLPPPPDRPLTEAPDVRVLDPHIHMTSRTTTDYEQMYAAGVRAVVEPAFWLGQPRTGVSSFTDYFDSLLGWERFRAAQHGIAHSCTLALNPKEANDPRLAGVLDVLPRYLAKDGVVAVGEIGFDSMTPRRTTAFRVQLDMAMEHELPVMVHTPHRDKAPAPAARWSSSRPPGCRRSTCSSTTATRPRSTWSTRSGAWAGFSIYPDTKMDPHRMVRILAGARPGPGARQLRRRLGQERPAAHRPHGRGHARRRVHRRRRRQGPVAQPGRVLLPERPARPRRAAGRRRRDLRGQLAAAGARA